MICVQFNESCSGKCEVQPIGLGVGVCSGGCVMCLLHSVNRAIIVFLIWLKLNKAFILPWHCVRDCFLHFFFYYFRRLSTLHTNKPKSHAAVY